MTNSAAAGIFHRVEKKYIVTQTQYDQIVDVLYTRMEPDEYNLSGGKYSVRSLYYDTPCYAFISDSLANPNYKEKIRLRSYSDPQPDEIIQMEIKKKISGIGNKRRTELPLKDAYKFLERGELPPFRDVSDSHVLREILAILSRNDMELRPSALISYDRLAFNGREDIGMRISFDTNLRGRLDDLRMESGAHGDLLLDEEFVVMEVKALFALPLWITSLFSSIKVFPRGFSKYRVLYHNKILSETEVLYA